MKIAASYLLEREPEPGHHLGLGHRDLRSYALVARHATPKAFARRARPTLDESLAQEFREAVRRGHADRGAVGPRGTLARASEPRPTRWIEPASRTLLLAGGDDARVAAAGVLGEFGGPVQLQPLRLATTFDARPVRAAALAALATIGGRPAVSILLQLADNALIDPAVRDAAVRGVLDLATGGWDDYGLAGERVALPSWLRHRLTQLPPGLGIEINQVLPLFE